MKLLKVAIAVCVLSLIILAQQTKMDILRRHGLGIPVPQYEEDVSHFLQIISFAPVGLGVGAAALFFAISFSAGMTDYWEK